MDAITRSRFLYSLTTFTKYFARTPASFQKTNKALFHCSLLLNVKGEPIKMPSLSPTMEEGKIVKWLKKEGETVNPGDVICDIETDKAVVAMEVEEQGILAKILVPENSSNVKVGSLIALMVAEGEDWKNVEMPTEGAVSASPPKDSAPPPDQPPKESPSKPAISGPPSIQIKMPSLSPTMTAGTIVKWLKKEGDTVSPGDVLCDIQTDKAVVSLETEEEGILAKIILGDDSKDVEVGTLIALMVGPGEDWKSVSVVELDTQKKADKTATTASPSPAGVTASSATTGKIFGPAVKALLDTYQVEADRIQSTGRKGRLLKEDVIKFVESNKLEKKPPKAVPPPGAKEATKTAVPAQQKEQAPGKKSKAQAPRSPVYKDIELSNMRMIIAKRLTQSKQEIPHSYAVMKCLVDKLLEAKAAVSETSRVSVNDLLIKATALALQIYPKANALVVKDEVKISKQVDVCVAVATEAGLYTPIIKSTNTKNVITISNEVRDLSTRARSGKLKPEEFQGGTFTISNLGMFGITHFKAIINPPQSCILAVGGTLENVDSDLKKKREMVLSLSYDRRSMEEWEAAEFMDTLKYIIENPNLMVKDVSKTSSVLGL